MANTTLLHAAENNLTSIDHTHNSSITGDIFACYTLLADANRRGSGVDPKHVYENAEVCRQVPLAELPPTLSNEFFIQATVLLVFAVLTCVSNGATCIILYQRGYLRSCMYFLVFVLSLFDILVALFCMMADGIWKLTFQWYGGELLCKAVKYFQMFAIYGSTYMLVAISIDRLLAIRSPHDSRMNGNARARLMVVAVMVSSAIFAIPQAFIFDVQYGPFLFRFQQCVVLQTLAPQTQLLYVLVTLMLQCVVPLVLIVIAYTLLFSTLWLEYRRPISAHLLRTREESDTVIGNTTPPPPLILANDNNNNNNAAAATLVVGANSNTNDRRHLSLPITTSSTHTQHALKAASSADYDSTTATIAASASGVSSSISTTNSEYNDSYAESQYSSNNISSPPVDSTNSTLSSSRDSNVPHVMHDRKLCDWTSGRKMNKKAKKARCRSCSAEQQNNKIITKNRQKLSATPAAAVDTHTALDATALLNLRRKHLMRRAMSRSMLMSMLIVASFIVCWGPYYTDTFVYLATSAASGGEPENPPPATSPSPITMLDSNSTEESGAGGSGEPTTASHGGVLFTFGMINSIVHPIIYGAVLLAGRCRTKKSAAWKSREERQQKVRHYYSSLQQQQHRQSEQQQQQQQKRRQSEYCENNVTLTSNVDHDYNGEEEEDEEAASTTHVVGNGEVVSAQL